MFKYYCEEELPFDWVHIFEKLTKTPGFHIRSHKENLSLLRLWIGHLTLVLH